MANVAACIIINNTHFFQSPYLFRKQIYTTHRIHKSLCVYDTLYIYVHSTLNGYLICGYCSTFTGWCGAFYCLYYINYTFHAHCIMDCKGTCLLCVYIAICMANGCSCPSHGACLYCNILHNGKGGWRCWLTLCRLDPHNNCLAYINRKQAEHKHIYKAENKHYFCKSYMT